MATQMSFDLMVRSLERSSEIAGEADMAPEVTRVYSDVLAPAADVFRKNHAAVAVAQSTARAKKLESQQQIWVFDPIYRGTRSVVLAFAPATVLPDALTAQTTDTDTLTAVTTLVSVVQSYAGQAWADELLAGRFGTFAAKTETAIKESIEANKALARAKLARIEAYAPVHGRFMAFKHVVRDILGASSVQYRRLHPRKAAAAQIEEEAAPDSGVIPADQGAPALAKGPLSGKVA